MKELLKSVHICQSYRKNKSGTFFYGPRCISAFWLLVLMHAVWSAIVMLSSVRPSVRLSVCLWRSVCRTQDTVGVDVESCAIVFLGRHFLFTFLKLLDTWCRMFRSSTTHGVNPNRRNFRVASGIASTIGLTTAIRFMFVISRPTVALP